MSRAAVASMFLTACLLLPALAAAETYGKGAFRRDHLRWRRSSPTPTPMWASGAHRGAGDRRLPDEGLLDGDPEEKGGGARLRVKVDDGVMVFPVTAKGKLAVAEGTVEAIPMEREQYVQLAGPPGRGEGARSSTPRASARAPSASSSSAARERGSNERRAEAPGGAPRTAARSTAAAPSASTSTGFASPTGWRWTSR